MLARVKVLDASSLYIFAPDGTGAPLPGSETQAPLQGTLPIVTDQFATVTVVPNEEIRRNPGNTLGDLLFATPTTLFFVPIMYSWLRKKPPMNLDAEIAHEAGE